MPDSFVFHRLFIDKRLVHLVLIDYFGGIFINFKHVAIFDKDDVLVGVIANVMLDKFLLPEQHAVFTVDRDDEFRFGRLDHYLDVALRSVS